MLKKSERLDLATFSNCFSKGKKSHSLYTTIVYCPREGFACSVVVGKKVSKKAPVRNSFRRRVYGVIEKIKNERGASGAYIVIIKPEVIKLSKKAFSVAIKEEVGRVIN